jgi:hypothetical protein
MSRVPRSAAQLHSPVVERCFANGRNVVSFQRSCVFLVPRGTPQSRRSKSHDKRAEDVVSFVSRLGTSLLIGTPERNWVRRARGLPRPGVSTRSPIRGPQRKRPVPANG